MLKIIKNLAGAKELSKNSQTKINGGGPSGGGEACGTCPPGTYQCKEWGPCLPPAVFHQCVTSCTSNCC